MSLKKEKSHLWIFQKYIKIFFSDGVWQWCQHSMMTNLVKFIQRCSMSLTVHLSFGVSFSRFHCCGHHGHGLWSSWFVAVMVCGHHGLWSSWCVAVMVCGRHGLWPSWFVVIMVCGRHGLLPSWYRPFSNYVIILFKMMTQIGVKRWCVQRFGWGVGWIFSWSIPISVFRWHIIQCCNNAMRFFLRVPDWPGISSGKIGWKV